LGGSVWPQAASANAAATANGSAFDIVFSFLLDGYAAWVWRRRGFYSPTVVLDTAG
jgi:hypothetical protein